MKHYKLRRREVVACDGMLDWVAWFGHATDEDRRIGLDVVEGHEVSTVFMGLDTNPGEHPPRGVFETRVVLATGEGGILAKYDSWAQAERGHDAMVGVLREAVQDTNLPAVALLQQLRQAAAK